MGNKNSKSMSGSYSMKGTTPAGVGVKKGSLTTNGNGPPPLSYPADPPDDENMNEIIEENVDVMLLLPNGTQKHQSVESNIPMMDLLIILAASNKLNPAAHSLVILTGDKWKQIDFKANKTIGALAGDERHVSVQIIKKVKEEKVKTKSAAQPFEMTYRFTVNLPHNQKKVLRISPKQTLGEVRQITCKDKGFDPNRYVFLLPSNPDNVVDDSTSVGDLKTSEINFVSVSMLEAASARSMPDLAMAAARAGTESSTSSGTRDDSGYMPGGGEKKAKRGFLSFLGKKDKKFKVHQDTEFEVQPRSKPKKSESFTTGGSYPGPENASSARPQTMYGDTSELDHFNMRRTTGDLHKYSTADYRKSTGSALLPVNENVALSVKSDMPQTAPPKKSGKKRAAPPPPQANANKPHTVQVEINIQPKSQERIEDLPEVRVPLKKIHSRNSSDSSGYHELAVSGAESPDANKTDNLQTTLDTTSIDSVENFNGDSGIRDMSPVRHRSANRVVAGAGSRESSLEPMAPGRKKKRAPLPPPGMSASPRVDSAVPESPSRCRARVQEEEFSALQAMEEVTMKFDIDTSDDDMQMVENSSVHSEDVDVSHRQGPATFIPPPPPTEPPPEDSEIVNLNMGGVNTVDIGVGDSTTSSAPNSAKSSPLNKELQKAMPEFKKHITRLSIDASDEGQSSSRSEQITDSEPSDRDHDASKDTSSENNRESSEITYQFTLDTVPANFRNEDKTDSDSEENFETEEIVEFYPAVPKVLELDSPRRIPDLDSPKEHRSLSLPPHSVPDEDVDNGNQELVEEEPKIVEKEEFVISLDELSNVEYSAMKPGEQAKPRRESDVPKVNYRIEFRSSMDSSRDYNEAEDYIEAIPASSVNQEPVFYDDRSMDNDSMYNNADDESMYNNDVKDMCSELSFTPNSEGEAEYMMEEKSISRIALPAQVTPVKNASPSREDSYASSTQIVLNHSGAGSPASASGTPRSARELSPRREEGFESPNMVQNQYQQMQLQLSNWQNQLMQNQKLLANSGAHEISTNQTAAGPLEDQSNLQLQQLQLQIQMQQQMMMQLQQSMQTLALQNALVAQQPVIQPMQPMMTPSPISQQQYTTPEVMNNIVPTTSTPIQSAPVVESPSLAPKLQSVPAPPPAPAAPPPPPPTDTYIATSKPKASKADAKYTKPKNKRFERELDPREQLMLDIRSFGKKHLHKVPVKATHWHK